MMVCFVRSVSGFTYGIGHPFKNINKVHGWDFNEMEVANVMKSFLNWTSFELPGEVVKNCPFKPKLGCYS